MLGTLTSRKTSQPVVAASHKGAVGKEINQFLKTKTLHKNYLHIIYEEQEAKPKHNFISYLLVEAVEQSVQEYGRGYLLFFSGNTQSSLI